MIVALSYTDKHRMPYYNQIFTENDIGLFATFAET